MDENTMHNATSPGHCVRSPRLILEHAHFVTTCRIDTLVEVDNYRNGGILHTGLRLLAKG